MVVIFGPVIIISKISLALIFCVVGLYISVYIYLLVCAGLVLSGLRECLRHVCNDCKLLRVLRWTVQLGQVGLTSGCEVRFMAELYSWGWCGYRRAVKWGSWGLMGLTSGCEVRFMAELYNDGVECLRLLNEIIADFDEVIILHDTRD